MHLFHDSSMVTFFQKKMNQNVATEATIMGEIAMGGKGTPLHCTIFLLKMPALLHDHENLMLSTFVPDVENSKFQSIVGTMLTVKGHSSFQS